MWNRRKEDEPAPRLSPQPPPQALPAREAIPMNALPAPRSPEPEMSRQASVGKSVVIKGQLFSREDLYVDGEVEGSVEMPESRLTVGPNGKLVATVKAREIVVVGTIHGNVEALEKIEIRKDAKLLGDIRTCRIVIEDNAFFKGSVDIVRPEPKPQPPPPPRPAAPPPEPRPQAQAAAAAGAEIKR